MIFTKQELHRVQKGDTVLLTKPVHQTGIVIKTSEVYCELNDTSTFVVWLNTGVVLTIEHTPVVLVGEAVQQ